MSATLKWVNKINNANLVTMTLLPNKYYEFPDYGDVPDTLPIHQHLQNIYHTIDTNDAGLLTDLLGYDLQCSAVEDSKEKGLDDEGQETPAQYQIITRPFIEGLMLLHNKNLCEIVKKILASGNTQLCDAFIDSTDNTALQKKQLFDWTEKQNRKVLTAIKSLNDYGEKLKAEGIEKGKEIISHCVKLTEAVAKLPEHSHLHIEAEDEPVGFNVSPNHQISLRSLQFKLEFCELLHSKDHIFNEQRDYKKLIADILLGVFSSGLLNLGNYLMTGKFLFFNNTETQNMIDHVDHIVRPYSMTI